MATPKPNSDCKPGPRPVEEAPDPGVTSSRADPAAPGAPEVDLEKLQQFRRVTVPPTWRKQWLLTETPTAPSSQLQDTVPPKKTLPGPLPRLEPEKPPREGDSEQPPESETRSAGPKPVPNATDVETPPEKSVYVAETHALASQETVKINRRAEQHEGLGSAAAFQRARGAAPESASRLRDRVRRLAPTLLATLGSGVVLAVGASVFLDDSDPAPKTNRQPPGPASRPTSSVHMAEHAEGPSGERTQPSVPSSTQRLHHSTAQRMLPSSSTRHGRNRGKASPPTVDETSSKKEGLAPSSSPRAERQVEDNLEPRGKRQDSVKFEQHAAAAPAHSFNQSKPPARPDPTPRAAPSASRPAEDPELDFKTPIFAD